MKVAVTKENDVFAIEASGIKTKGDVQEVICQLQLVEDQMVDGLGRFEIATDKSSVSIKGRVVFSELNTENGAKIHGFNNQK